MSLNIKRFVIRTRAVDNYQFNLILPTATELTSGSSGDRLSIQPLTLSEGPAADAVPFAVPYVSACTCLPKTCLDTLLAALRRRRDRERTLCLSRASDISHCRGPLVDPLSCSERAMTGNLILLENLSKHILENKCQTLLPPVHCDLGMAASWLLQNCSCAAKQRGTRGGWQPIPALALLSLLGWWEWGSRARPGDTRSHTHNLAAPRPTALSCLSLELILTLPAHFRSQKVGAEGG